MVKEDNILIKYYINDKPYTYEEMEDFEKKIYKCQLIKKDTPKISVDISKIINRKIETFEDRDYNLPQNIFIINGYKGRTIVGRKILSQLSIDNKINAINCSMITASMILGILKKKIKHGKKIMIEYYPIEDSEKLTVFEELKNDLTYNIYFPYKYRDFVAGKEEISPAAGWSFNPNRKEYLGYGEEHIRNYTADYFKKYPLDKKKIYDPACSTGEFLNCFQRHFPNCITIGHDLSKEMINYAKDYVNEACCCNAINSPLNDKSMDIMFLRFLNSEVISTRIAYKIMRVLLKKVRKNGIIVCFGHTPILIKKEWFIKNGLKVINSIGYDKNYDAVFQYYVLEVE